MASPVVVDYRINGGRYLSAQLDANEVSLDQQQRELRLGVGEALPVLLELGRVGVGVAQPLPLRNDPVDLGPDRLDAQKRWVACHDDISSTHASDFLGYHRAPCASC
jgi:hypothetical protein